MPEGEERSFCHVPVRAFLHGIIFKAGQLARTLIESDWKTSCRVIISEEDIGDSRTTGLTGIPCLQDSIACFRFGSQGDSGTGEVDEYDLLSCFLQFGKQTALDRWKFDGFAVTSLEAGNVDMHFLTFHCRGYTSGKDDNICLFYLVYGLFQVNGNFASHVKIECGITVAESKINLDTIFFSGFCLEGVDFGLVFEIHACGNFLAVN